MALIKNAFLNAFCNKDSSYGVKPKNMLIIYFESHFI